MADRGHLPVTAAWLPTPNDDASGKNVDRLTAPRPSPTMGLSHTRSGEADRPPALVSPFGRTPRQPSSRLYSSSGLVRHSSHRAR